MQEYRSFTDTFTITRSLNTHDHCESFHCDFSDEDVLRVTTARGPHEAVVSFEQMNIAGIGISQVQKAPFKAESGTQAVEVRRRLHGLVALCLVFRSLLHAFALCLLV
jgi:hypothetical protein